MIVVAMGRGMGGGIDQEFGISKQMQPLYVGWINNKVLLWENRNYIQHLTQNHNGEEYEKECITKSLCYTAEITCSIVKQLYFNKNKF